MWFKQHNVHRLIWIQKKPNDFLKIAETLDKYRMKQIFSCALSKMQKSTRYGQVKSRKSQCLVSRPSTGIGEGKRNRISSRERMGIMCVISLKALVTENLRQHPQRGQGWNGRCQLSCCFLSISLTHWHYPQNLGWFPKYLTSPIKAFQ